MLRACLTTLSALGLGQGLDLDADFPGCVAHLADEVAIGEHAMEAAEVSRHVLGIRVQSSMVHQMEHRANVLLRSSWRGAEVG